MNNTIYYGDFVVVSKTGGSSYIEGQVFFNKGGAEDLSISAKFNNKMNSDSLIQDNIYYMYYFIVGSVAENGDIASVQVLLDEKLNTLNMSNINYPFKTHGEIIFTSYTQDILTIDEMGKINVKKEGLAKIVGTSILNKNQALVFYIYVVNYFDPESEITDNNSKTSIVYPIESTEVVPLNDSIIKLRGNNSSTIYVLPKYDANILIEQTDSKSIYFNSDRNGFSNFYNVAFNIEKNNHVSASVLASDKLNISIVESMITFRKTQNTEENIYGLTITPRLELELTENNKSIVYYSNVNKCLESARVDYKYGALSITNKNYNKVTMISSKIVNDVITIESTDNVIENEMPLYYITDSNNVIIQGNIEDSNEVNGLFSVEFKISPSTNPIPNEFGVYTHKIDMRMSINKNSDLYKNKYTNNIYGEYSLHIQARTNTIISKTITISFERTSPNSLVVDNYTTLKDMNFNTGVSSESDYAYPGISGLLAITVSPEDCDFDYILIENADVNNQLGHAYANFGFLAKKQDAEGSSSIFDNKYISGSNTVNGIKLALKDIINIYDKITYLDSNTQERHYDNYKGVIYIQYDMGSYNVIDESMSSINVSLIKDDQILYSVTKNLTIKLQNYVSVEIDGKTGMYNQEGFYVSYNVARGLKYKLNINTYGFDVKNIQLTVSNSSLGEILYENGSYYLQVTPNSINYDSDNNIFHITINAKQIEGEIVRTASSMTNIVVNEYVLNYNGDIVKNEDILEGMGNGVINVQVGTKTTFSVDLFEYIEYDEKNNEVIAKIEQFMSDLAYKGSWSSYTNLISDFLPDYSEAKDEASFNNSERCFYKLGYENDIAKKGENYYYKYNGLDIIPTKTHSPMDKFFYFTFKVKFENKDGLYTAIPINSNDQDTTVANLIKTTFILNVYTESSEESPIPIYDYEDFIQMGKYGYYILLNDITLPNVPSEDGKIKAFKPLNAQFASFDGNGHTINFAGTYDMGNLSDIGVFSSVSSGSVIKNLNVYYNQATDGSDSNVNKDDTYLLQGKKTVKFKTNAKDFIFGGLAAKNDGIITNCHVFTHDEVDKYYIAVIANNALTSDSYISGLVGVNNGYITNSYVSVNIQSPFNIAGVVAENTGKIAACYFKGGILTNNSQFDQHVSGFALTNSANAQIITSYVAGESTPNSIYSKDQDSLIASTLPSAGFIYKNKGYISDCYTDIDLTHTTSDMAGFVLYNSGKIKNSFSLSILRNNVTASAGFARYNDLDKKQGEFWDCYYFYNKDLGSNSESQGFISEEGNLNTSLVQKEYPGIKRLNAGEFGDLNNFEKYSYTEYMGTNSIWFFAKQGSTSSNYISYNPIVESITEEKKGSQNLTRTTYLKENLIFAANRLELVNPNIQALSIKKFHYSELDTDTGKVTYHYIDDEMAPNYGTIHNPRLIYNANSMENQILNQTASTGLNITDYRIISDIDYLNHEGLSNLYKITYAGIMEGNGMKISDITLASMERMKSAGMFAQVGYSSSKKGVVKNLTINPKQVTFTNTNNVGVLTGILKYGEIYDVSILNNATSTVTVSGMNFVGGIVGKAVDSYIIKDVNSQMNTAASFTPLSDNFYLETYLNDSLYSYTLK